MNTTDRDSHPPQSDQQEMRIEDNAKSTHPNPPQQKKDKLLPGMINASLSPLAFTQLCGQMSGYAFVKVVVDRRNNQIHFINNRAYEFHADYIAEHCLSTPSKEIRKRINDFNTSVYLNPDRDFFLGIISRHNRDNEQFYVLETVEIDNMDEEMVLAFYGKVRANLDDSNPLYFKPANHDQEAQIEKIDPKELPRLLNHELFASAPFIALNEGSTHGRLRIFEDEASFQAQFDSIKWFDILVMNKVPDNIPRIAGIINSHHTTPLSHTNVLAHGWQIPNSIQQGVIKNLHKSQLNNEWVYYEVSENSHEATIRKSVRPEATHHAPTWRTNAVSIEDPEINSTDIRSLDRLRLRDSFKYGTKAANLGELDHILFAGSTKLTGFYRISRPPRENLLPYLDQQLALCHLNWKKTTAAAKKERDTHSANTFAKERPSSSYNFSSNSQRSLDRSAQQEHFELASLDFLRQHIKIPKGIAIPFALQRQFLETSAPIQQCIGKLKMALELDAPVIDSLCIELQGLIRRTRFSLEMRDYIDSQIAAYLGGVSTFVIRSSSNAEDLEDFSAAGIYESINHVTTAENIFESIKQVWSSLVTPRSIRLRQQVGISLDQCYMGVIIQEEVESDFGGVMVTSNPMNASDIRNVYINVSTDSVQSVVEGTSLPIQYLFNTLEGGGRTLSLGSSDTDLAESQKKTIQNLAFAGRLLQSHFSTDYTFSSSADIEWAIKGKDIYILQLRPYGS